MTHKRKLSSCGHIFLIYPSLRIQTRLAATNNIYHVESDTDLDSWSPARTVLEPDSGNVKNLR